MDGVFSTLTERRLAEGITYDTKNEFCQIIKVLLSHVKMSHYQQYVHHHPLQCGEFRRKGVAHIVYFKYIKNRFQIAGGTFDHGEPESGVGLVRNRCSCSGFGAQLSIKIDIHPKNFRLKSYERRDENSREKSPQRGASPHT